MTSDDRGPTTPPKVSLNVMTFDEFVRCTSTILTPVLTDLGYVEGKPVNRISYFWRDYLSKHYLLHAYCEPREHYADVRITKHGVPGILGRNLYKLVQELGRPTDKYQRRQYAPLSEQLSFFARLMKNELPDILVGETPLGDEFFKVLLT